MSRSRFRLVAVLIGVALVAAACGDSDDADDVATDTTAASETTAAPDTTSAETTEPPETTVPPETTAPPAGGGGSDGELKIGYLLPQTGDLSAIIDALARPLEMGVEEITAAGGQVTLIPTDSGTDPNVASTAVDGLLADDVDAIIGAAASTVSLSVIDKITGSEVVQCSGSNTGAVFTDYDDGGYYFRTAPPDNLQSPALADLIAGDGGTSVAIMFRNDEYGAGFDELLTQALEANGLTVAARVGYDPGATSFDAEASEVAAAGVDSIVLITFGEGAAVAQGLIEAGVGPDVTQWYVTDGFKDAVGATDITPDDPAVLEGVRGTAPSVAPPNGEPTFPDRFEAFSPGTPTIFSPHKYDCLVVLTLASEVAGTDDPTVFVNEMNGVTQGGTKCVTYEECSALIAEGTDIDYDGASGPLEFTEAGEPGAGVYDVYEYDAEGSANNEDQVEIG